MTIAEFYRAEAARCRDRAEKAKSPATYRVKEALTAEAAIKRAIRRFLAIR